MANFGREDDKFNVVNTVLRCLWNNEVWGGGNAKNVVTYSVPNLEDRLEWETKLVDHQWEMVNWTMGQDKEG